MEAEEDNRKKTFFRKPAAHLWGVTVVVIIYTVWCLLLVILTASGHLLNSQSFEYTNQSEVSRLREEANLVYMWSGLSLPVCLLVLLEFWRKKGRYFKMLCGTTSVLFVFMIVTFRIRWEKETEEIKLFENRYLALLPLRDPTGFTQNQTSNTTYHQHNNVHLWQVEFKCCGLQRYKDWGSSIPDSCLCDGGINSSDCAAVGISLVYEKPCLPTVLSLAEKRSTTFWIIMIVWMIVVSVPIAISVLFLCLLLFIFCHTLLYEPCVDAVNKRIYKMRGGEEMIPVVFIRNSNNNQTEEEHGKDGEAEENSTGDDVVLNVDRQEAVEEKWYKNSVTIIPLSLLRRLEEELDPPPVQHKAWCSCIMSCKLRYFYTILIEEDSPLLPSGAVLADANKPSTDCFWADGHHIFSVEKIVWPQL